MIKKGEEVDKGIKKASERRLFLSIVI